MKTRTTPILGFVRKPLLDDSPSRRSPRKAHDSENRATVFRQSLAFTFASIAALLAISAAGVHAGEGAFTKAIEHAQARTVKIYGAGIGRDPGYATGLIVSDDGKILAARGVYLLGERIRVVLPDGSEHRARVERKDEAHQLALLGIEAATPSYFKLSPRPDANKGDWVVVVSNAFGVASGREPLSVGLGVFSLRTDLELKRGTQDVDYQGEIVLIDAITSNPGAPGGAVVSVEGGLVGMIGKNIESKNTGTRLNYAVPADVLARFVSGKLEVAKTPPEPPRGANPDLGIRLFTLGGTRAPAFIDRVVPKSPAAAAGLKADDLILTLDNQRIRTIREFRDLVKTLDPRKPVRVLLKRGDKLITVTIHAAVDNEKK